MEESRVVHKIALEDICTEKEFQYGRRRDMFERVALAEVVAGGGFTWDSVTRTAEFILREADKFAKGEYEAVADAGTWRE